jgi:thiosulfate dehydrogenase (quinone) large subunit
VLRIVMGLTFLRALLDKMFGLGYSTSSAQPWIHGGSPTAGFLAHVEVGPLQSMLRDLAGTGVADWLFMLALFGIGTALLVGVGMRVAATAGVLLLTSMWRFLAMPASLRYLPASPDGMTKRQPGASVSDVIN